MDFGMIDGLVKSQIAKREGKPFKVLDWIKVEELIKEHDIKNACVGLEEDWAETSAVCLIDGVKCQSPEDTGQYGFYGGSLWATPILYDSDADKSYECWTVNPDYDPEYWHWKE